MKLRLIKGLPWVSAKLIYQGQMIELKHILVDTGSASSVFSADPLQTIGLHMEPNDTVRRIRGVGGTEFVFTKQVDSLAVGKLRVDQFVIEVGAMDYGFSLDGILGMDFLLGTRAKLNFNQLTIR